MKTLIPFLLLALFSASACSNKDCEENFTGELCFDNKTDSFYVDVYLDDQKIYVLNPQERQCQDDVAGGAHAYQLVYRRIAPGTGYIRNSTLHVYPCDRSVVEAR